MTMSSTITAPSALLLVWLLLTVLAVVQSFVIPLYQQQHHSPQGITFTITTASLSSSSRLLSSNNPFNYNFDANGSNEDDDDDGMMIDLSSQDWRAFRAHLVQAESSIQGRGVLARSGNRKEQQEQAPQDEQEEESCVPESGDCDLDGIGNVYGLKYTRRISAGGGGPGSGGNMQVPPAHSSLSNNQAAMMPSLSSQRPSTSTMPSSLDESSMSPASWAYDSGHLIETGAVLLGGVEQEFGFGLRQQYFHKAAILVLDHCESTFTKGIILNRPTDLYLQDDINPGIQWRVWFGGDVQGLESEQPDLVCLHSLDDPQAKHASIPVMNDLQWTTFDNAKRLVRAGVASPNDFWVFCGYAGWGAGQLLSELERNSWYAVNTDPHTLLQELARQSQHSNDPREAGLETWTMLMERIGRGETAQSYQGVFDDLMLKEWAHQHLLSIESGGGAGNQHRDPDIGYPPSTQEWLQKDPVDRLLSRAQMSSRGEEVIPGTLVRASSHDRSPFLLHDQELHKSVVLILSDDEQITVGAILNRPSAKGLDVRIAPSGSSSSVNRSGEGRKITLPLRFGGQYSVKNGESLVWLHCNSILRAAQVGEPIGGRSTGGIWKCSAVDVTTAIGQGLATPEDFFVVTGVTVWTKGEGGTSRGIQGEIRKGNFEVIPDSKVESVWEALSKQQVLTTSTLTRNLYHAETAWLEGGTPEQDSSWSNMVGDSFASPTMGGGGGGMWEQQHQRSDDPSVFQSHVTVSQLSDEALRNWMSIFLLGSSPAMRD